MAGSDPNLQKGPQTTLYPKDTYATWANPSRLCVCARLMNNVHRLVLALRQADTSATGP